MLVIGDEITTHKNRNCVGPVNIPKNFLPCFCVVGGIARIRRKRSRVVQRYKFANDVWPFALAPRTVAITAFGLWYCT
jgi:hypothetical protein